MARLLSTLFALALLAAACDGEATPAVQVDEVRRAQVTETVSAPGRLAPAAQEEVLAGTAGTVAAILVDDGGTVAGGEVVVRLDSADLEDALAQVEAARAALEDLPAPLDLGPLAGVEPPALQGGAVPVPELDLSIAPVNPAEAVVAELDAQVRPSIADARAALPALVEELRAAVERARSGLDTWADELVAELPPDVAAEITPPAHELPELPDATAAEDALDRLEGAYEDARAALLAAGAAAAGQQAAAAEELAAAAQGVAAGMTASLDAAVEEIAAAQGAVQQATVAALQEQAAQAARAQSADLDAAAEQLAAREDALTVEAPFGGVVELAPVGATTPELEALGGLGAGDLGAGLGLGGVDLAGDGGATGSGAPLRVGAPVRPGQPLFTVYDVSEWYVEADVDEIDAPAVAVGQRAAVRVDAFPGEVFDGVVESVRLAARSSLTGAVVYPARIRLLDFPVDPGPRVGMTASVDVTTAVLDAALAVPARALVRRDGTDAVYVVRDGRAEVVPVTVTALGEERAAVEGALEVGDTVVVAGYEDLPDGAEVEVD